MGTEPKSLRSKSVYASSHPPFSYCTPPFPAEKKRPYVRAGAARRSSFPSLKSSAARAPCLAATSTDHVQEQRQGGRLFQTNLGPFPSRTLHRIRPSQNQSTFFLFLQTQFLDDVKKRRRSSQLFDTMIAFDITSSPAGAAGNKY